MLEYISFRHRQLNICLTNNEVEGISWYQLRGFWCQNKWHYGYDGTRQVLCHVHSAVSWTSKWPCQISSEPLIMSLFFNFTASGSSILFSIKGIILRLLTGPRQFLNDVSHLPLVHSLKGLAFSQMSLHLPEQAQRQSGSSACVTYTTSYGTDEVTWLLSHEWDGGFTAVSAVISTLEHSNSQTTIRSWGFRWMAINASQWFKIKPSRSIDSSVLSVFTSFYFPLLLCLSNKADLS